MASHDAHEINGKARPRGSRSGILAFQADSIARTSAALSAALIRLLSSHADKRISEKALCESAGLKSTVALHSTANAELLRKLDEHNESVREQKTPESAHSNAEDDKDKLILRQDAEISALLRENQKLRRQLKALKERTGTMN